MNEIDHSNRLSKLRTVAYAVAALFCLKVLLETLYEYRWYFPADFESSTFLIGRRDTFVGSYRTAFYAHIISGPVVIVVGSILMAIGGRPRLARIHRPLGRIQMLIVIAVVVPSGFVMALQAYTGAIAASGFASHSIVTGIAAIAAVYHALGRRFQLHRRWATRCFILLCSPLLLRVISGATIVMQVDSDWTYRLTAWLSWMIPIAMYEVWWRCSAGRGEKAPRRVYPHKTEEAFL